MSDMRVIIFGATGMLGQGVLRESLLAPDVEQVLAVTRTPTGVQHPKLREFKVDDFTDLSPVSDELGDFDACFYFLGVSSAGMTEADYTRISYDYPVAAARALAQFNPDITFVYLSGDGANENGRMMWQRVRGRTEKTITEMLPNGYAFRPGLVRPTHGARKKHSPALLAFYTVLAPLLAVVERIAPRAVAGTDRIGRTMLDIARHPRAHHILTQRDVV